MQQVSSSFRDPSGLVYKQNNKIFRQVNKRYKVHYDLLLKSGLYSGLTKSGLLIEHEEQSINLAFDKTSAYKVIKPTKIPYISYPYEWSFSQLKDAALLTLEVQTQALALGLSLKDASAYNVQFLEGRPVLIDTLSFEAYQEGEPWVAYRQFCQHFLAPLALMSYTDVTLNELSKIFIDGIPLELASKLLPYHTRFKPSLASHIHIHARAQSRYSASQGNTRRPSMSLRALRGLVRHLVVSTEKLHWKPGDTEWGEYYTFTNYTSKSFAQKKRIVEFYLDKAQPQTLLDVGANTGLFSRIASKRGINTIAFDIDPVAVEKNYRQVKLNHEQHILPLKTDLTNPSPSLGWAHTERDSLLGRGPADATMALALIHHLAIANNVPLDQCAKFFSLSSRYLIIEFVPKADSQVKKLLATREDIFSGYSERGFEEAFMRHYKILQKDRVKGSRRTMYLMKTI